MTCLYQKSHRLYSVCGVYWQGGDVVVVERLVGGHSKRQLQ